MCSFQLTESQGTAVFDVSAPSTVAKTADASCDAPASHISLSQPAKLPASLICGGVLSNTVRKFDQLGHWEFGQYERKSD